MQLMVLLSLWTASATEVVWLTPAGSEEADRMAEIAASVGPPLAAIDFRAAASDIVEADEAAYRELEAVVQSSRAFEAKLDGELVIMRDLDPAVENITIVRDEADRNRLFAALTYQGFAVDRFFMDQLGADDRASLFRYDLAGEWIERPWMDAVAIEPDRSATAYEIAEAPQRVAYAEVRDEVRRETLPARILFSNGLPDNATLVIDGRQVTGAQASVQPGHHYVHVALDGRVIFRDEVELRSAGFVNLEISVTDLVWNRWRTGVLNGNEPDLPADLRPSLDVFGGEVVLAWIEKDKVKAVKLGPEGYTAVSTRASASDGKGGDSDRGLSIGLGVLGGWFSSGEFYTQNPLADDGTAFSPTVATVNAGAIGFDVDVNYDLGLFRVAVGMNAVVTLGERHFAQYNGDSKTRFRPQPYLAVGIPWVQVTAGYMFPFHPTVGGRATVGLFEGLELRVSGWVGIGGPRSRADGTNYSSLPIYSAVGGIGYRIPVMRR